MVGNLRTDEDIIAWLEQEYAQPFEGWDFSYLRGRRTPLGSLPWDYGSIVLRYLSKSSSVLDIDTGGGEALAGILAKSDFSCLKTSAAFECNNNGRNKLAFAACELAI